MENFIMEDVKGYEGKYAVTTTGLVWSFKNKKFLKPYTMRNGYLQVCLCGKKHPVKKLIHRLVAETFLPPFGEDPNLQVDHIDRDKTNNCLENLQWLTPADNTRKDQAKVVVQHKEGHPDLIVAIYPSMTEAGRANGMNSFVIQYQCDGNLKNSNPIFRYATAEEAKAFQYVKNNK